MHVSVILMTALSMSMQIMLILHSWHLLKTFKPLKLWTEGWSLFIASMICVMLRRSWKTMAYFYQIQTDPTPIGLNWVIVGCIAEIVNSTLWLLFIRKMKIMFVDCIGLPWDGEERRK